MLRHRTNLWMRRGLAASGQAVAYAADGQNVDAQFLAELGDVLMNIFFQ